MRHIHTQTHIKNINKNVIIVTAKNKKKKN